MSFPDPDSSFYRLGDNVELSAIPYEDFFFLNWEGDVPLDKVNDNPLTITMDSEKSITAGRMPIREKIKIGSNKTMHFCFNINFSPFLLDFYI